MRMVVFLIFLAPLLAFAQKIVSTKVRAMDKPGTLFNVQEADLFPLTDMEGNSYDTTVIGTQVWMKEDLRATRYTNGELIGSYTGLYGQLYDWHTANGSRKVCPLGWRIPSLEDWSVLTDYLGGDSLAGGKLKEAGLTHWTSPNAEATNSSGFTALPGGLYSDAQNVLVGLEARYWSSTEVFDQPHFSYLAVEQVLFHDYGGPSVVTTLAVQNVIPKNASVAVRCLKGPEIVPNQIVPNQIVLNEPYPNPFINEVSIDYVLSQEAATMNAEIEIYNKLGARVSLVSAPLVEGAGQWVWQAAEYPAGLYFVRLSLGDQVVTRKVMKQ